MAILVVIALVVILVLNIVGLYQKNTKSTCKSKTHLGGKTVLVTGGTSGMGLEVALDFAYREAKVIIACPFPEDGKIAKKLIVEKTGNEKVVFKILDLASLESVRSFAKDILDKEDRLDILMNNAGVLIDGDFLTRDGINFILQVNYFGHFLLTLLLLPLLKKTGSISEPARIINISSIAHWAGRFDENYFNRTGYWFKIQLYSNSKLFLLLFSHELSKKLNNSCVVINSVHPGLMATRMALSIGKIPRIIRIFMVAVLLKSTWEGAQTSLYVALSPKAGRVSGEYFTNCKLSRAASWAYCDKSAARLWEESVRLVKLRDHELSNCF